MPQMGESVVEGTIERWEVREGDFVEKDQTLCEITTDKVDAEIPAPESGTVQKLLCLEGETVEVGADLAILETGPGAGREDSADVPVPDSEPQRAPAEAPATTASDRASPLARRLAAERGVDLRRPPK